MTKTTPPLTALALLLAFGLSAAPAHAQFFHTFVSAASGNDGNNCDRLTPCRTFQGAHNKTNPDGEITVLDPGDYGGLTITKGISIVNDGVGEASILVSGSTGITINANTTSKVNLRGLTVKGIGGGSGLHGLQFNIGASLSITNSVFRNHSGNGITFAPNTNNDPESLSISNTLVADNVGHGVEIRPTANVIIRASIRGIEMVNNGAEGMSVNGGAGFSAGAINVTVMDSVSANNGGDGFFVHTNAQNMPTKLMVLRSAIANNNGHGLTSSNAPNATLLIGQSSVNDNAGSWDATGGATLQSFGDNYIAGNGDGDPAPPPIARK